MSLEPPHKTGVQEIDQQVITSRRFHAMNLESPPKTTVQDIDQQAIISEAPPQTMPANLLTLPRELRDEIYIYLALSSSFAFLLTCHQINEEGTPLLYKHGIYHRRALILRKETLPRRPKPVPIARIQNIRIFMPPTSLTHDGQPGYEISGRTTQRLNRFAGTAIQRGICHVDLQGWGVSEGLAAVLRGFGGFDIVRVNWLLRYREELHGDVLDFKNYRKLHWMRCTEEKLFVALGRAKFRSEKKTTGAKGLEGELVIAEFRPRESRQ